MNITELEVGGKTYKNVPVDGLKELGLSEDEIAVEVVKQTKTNVFLSIKLKATKVRAIATEYTDPIYLLGLVNKAQIARAILSSAATDKDIEVITEELQERIESGDSPKGYTIEELATEQVAKQCALVKQANFVEYYEKGAIAQISALDDFDEIQTAEDELEASADAYIETLTAE